MSVFLRKYGVEATVEFPLIDFGATDYEATPVAHAAGDTTLVKNGASAGNTANAFAHVTKGLYKIVVSAAEMQAARIQVLIIDQTSPKAWEDQAITIETYGNASAQHVFDLGTATVVLTDASLTAAKFAANAIAAAAIADGAFTSAKFADAFLSAAKIADNAIAAAKIAADAVTKIQANLATSANQTTILARIGAFTGTGINTILGFLKAVMSKAADLTPSDVGGTFNNTTDSLEALQELMHPISPGNGTKTVVLHYEHADGSDVSDADVWVTTTADPEGLTKASGKTDSSGNVTVFLDPGTYYRHMQKDGEVPKLNEQTVVTA